MRVLVVEDEPELAAKLARALDTAGLVTDVAHDGREADFLGRSEPYDAAILDLLSEPQRPTQPKRDLTRDIRRVIVRLPQRCQRLLSLRYGLGYGPSEVAAKMGYQPSSIRKITNRCLSALSRELMTVGFLRKPEE